MTVILPAVIIVSCSGVRLEEREDRPVVTFGDTYICEVKSVLDGDRFRSGSDIGVMAYYQPAGVEWETYKSQAKPEFMYNQKVSYDGTSWTYSPVMYWPQVEGAKLNFYSYFPFDDGSCGYGVTVSQPDVTGEPTLVFELNEKADVDLMVAEKEGCTAADGSVSMSFRHLLTKVQFKFSVSYDDGYSYVVRNILLEDVAKKADYSWETDSFSVQETGSIDISAGEDERHLIDSTEPVLIEEFTVYLMPEKLGPVSINFNNEDPRTLDLSGIDLTPAKVMTIHMIIELNGLKFNTSVENWVDGGTANGEIH